MMANSRANDDAVQRKMEEMKKKNEEIMRRHAEIELDKRNADEISKTVITQERKTVRTPSTRAARSRKIPEAKEVKEKETRHLSELPKTENGPPPDPKYRFLSDPSRKRSYSEWKEGYSPQEPNRVLENSPRQQFHRHPKNFGGSDFQNVKSTMEQQRISAKQRASAHPEKNSDLTMCMTGRERIKHNEWLKEREEVDKKRIERQRTAVGTWSREWDNDKVFGNDSGEAIPRREPGDDSLKVFPSSQPPLPFKGSNNRPIKNIPATSKTLHEPTEKGDCAVPPASPKPRRTSAKAREFIKPARPKPLSKDEKKQPWTNWTYLRPTESNVAVLPGFGSVSVKPLYPGWKPKTPSSQDKDINSPRNEVQYDLENTGIPVDNSDINSDDISKLMGKLILNTLGTEKSILPGITVVSSSEGKSFKLNSENPVHLLSSYGNVLDSDDETFSSEKEHLHQNVTSKESAIFDSEDDEEWEDVSGDEDVVSVVQPID